MAYLLLPFSASLLYVVGALFLKEASSRGVGLFRLTAFTNLFFGIVFAALWVLGGRLREPAAWVQPAATAALFLLGQVFAIVALQRGDVSVATPVMGLKVVLVALFVTLIVGERVPPAIWIAAALSSAGIVFLSRGGGSTPGSGRTAPALIFGGLAAAAFALFDVLVQKWAPAWGAGRFLPIMMGFVALYSALPLPLQRDDLGVAPLGSWRPLLLAGFCLAVQGAMLISSLALYARATTINVVYSARGLWSVLAVWVVGHWFGNRERELGAAVLRTRLLGAALLLAAIVLVVVRH
jgi:drug/metabolite transporter (DMT)-like permease